MALTNTNRTASISGQSAVGDSTVAYLGANIQSNGAVSINITISDTALYTQNQTAVDADIKAFQADAITTAQGGIA